MPTNFYGKSRTTPTVDYLVVAGGGGGGTTNAGGGGAGGVLTASGFTVASSTLITVTVGGGGAPNTSGGAVSGSGQNSITFVVNGVSYLVTTSSNNGVNPALDVFSQPGTQIDPWITASSNYNANGSYIGSAATPVADADSLNGEYIQIDLPSAITLKAISLVSTQLANLSGRINYFSILGRNSNDASGEYIMIDTNRDYSSTETTGYVLLSKNSTAYSSYRLVIQSVIIIIFMLLSLLLLLLLSVQYYYYYYSYYYYAIQCIIIIIYMLCCYPALILLLLLCTPTLSQEKLRSIGLPPFLSLEPWIRQAELSALYCLFLQKQKQ
jgi:hypothetical protein